MITLRVTLKWGDKITAVVHATGREPFVAKGIVHTVLPVKGVFFAQLSENGRVAHNSYFNSDDEGTTWVRGHIDVESPEALRRHYPAKEAAKALDT